MTKAIRHRLHLSQREDGFTLVELVVAMMIIAGVLLALIAVQISAATTIVEARKRTQATAYANEAIEQLRSLPWAYVSAGVYRNFETVGGDDPWASNGVLTVDGSTYTLRRIAAGQEDFDPPRLPLFDGSGRNVQTFQDASQTNAEFTVRSYAVEPWTGPADSTVGLVVIVEWENNKGTTSHTKVESLAYRGEGCGSELDTPYLGACQEYFDANSQSGTVTTTVTAVSVPVVGSPEVPVNLLYPTGNPYYSLNMRSAVASAAVTSQQVTTVTSAALFGGTSLDDNDAATEPQEEGWVSGYSVMKALATDDVSSPDAAPNEGPTSWTVSESTASVSESGHGITFTGRSDYARPATSHASTTAQCMTGIAAGQACAATTFGNYASIEGGSGYILMTVDGQIFRLSRRLAESTPPANADQAWVARFTAASGSASLGCTVVSSSGCVAAGASRTIADLSVGRVVGTTWANGHAPTGIVTVGSRTGCTSGATDSVLVQRGPSQKTAAATTARCGRLSYWNGTTYTQVDYSTGALGPYVTAPVTWTSGGYTVQAVANIEILATSQSTAGSDPNCIEDACAITARAGSISITVEYTVTTPSATYIVVSTTVIDGASAFATFKAAPSA